MKRSAPRRPARAGKSNPLFAPENPIAPETLCTTRAVLI